MMSTPGIVPGQPQSVPRRHRPEDAAMHITVSDPVQHADGLNKYTSYRVDVRPPVTTPADQPQDVHMTNTAHSAVLRRYSDFLWLYERLHEERPGAIVPPLPDKQPVGRFSPAFVEDRRVQLERFLRRAATHPEMADAVCLGTFLRADDVTFQAAKQTKAVAVPAGNPSMMMHPAQPISPAKKDGFKRWFAEAKTSMTGELVRSPDDDIFEEIQRYIHGLDTQMRNVSHQATGLVRKGKEIANGLFEFGLAFNLLGQSEADALGDALGKMGSTADRLSVLSAEHAEKEMAQFEEPLQDYIKMIHGVKLALQRRHEKRLTYSACCATVESKQQALSKMRSQIAHNNKVYDAEMSLRRAQEACEASREDFAVTSQRVLREVDRFKREKTEDMRRTVLDYINLQVDYNKRMEEVWAALIPQLEQVQLDSNSNAIQPDGSAPTSAPAPAFVGSPQTHAPPQMMAPNQQAHTMSSPIPQQSMAQSMMYAPSSGLPAPQNMAASVPSLVPGGTSSLSVQYRDPPSGL